jgi:hypothetical protein
MKNGPGVQLGTLAVAKCSAAKFVCSISAPLRGALKQAHENRVFSIAFH